MTGPGPRVAVAMSGGVDSSLAAALLVRTGVEAFGITLRLRPDGPALPGRGDTDVEAAGAAAGRLGIPHHVVDAREAFDRHVLRPAWEEYDRGRTPNPCVLCNREVKFGVLWEHARRLGAERLATGHYARIERAADGRPVLRRGRDRRKDQSYFLSGLSDEQLARIVLPLGDLTKDEARARARELGLPNADRPGSRDACFGTLDGSFAEALRARFGGAARGGRVVDRSGAELGRHDGLHRFTVGQRQGLGIARGARAYVLALDGASGDVVIGTWDELLCGGVEATLVRWHEPPAAWPARLEAQTRYRQPVVAAEVTGAGGGRLDVRFGERVAGVAPGQAIVFYDGERVVGGGWIDALRR
ncbi:MAG: tRNA 2-thiouridine(34) synthase MnmA [Deltaproteobacteria bacterium]|nr:tRNA 2-thiouridine(34) synthase MnmA [Deltaproteobacteria bacterium]